MATAAPVPITRPPSPLLALTEFPRALAEFGTLFPAAPVLASAPRGDGHPVLVLPGFTTTDRSTAVLRRYLTRLGYDAHTWDLGRNLGPKAIGYEGEKLVERLERCNDATGRTVSLCRLVAGRRDGADRGAQASGRGAVGDLARLPLHRHAEGDERLARLRADDGAEDRRCADGGAAARRRSATPPPVPSTAIWSREDGIVAWQNCVEPFDTNSDNIEVHGQPLRARRQPCRPLRRRGPSAKPEGAWQPFDRSAGPRSWFYLGRARLTRPSSVHDLRRAGFASARPISIMGG
ncbi:esterase/lipase family protein [Sphingomonas sp. MMS24-JH45]